VRLSAVPVRTVSPSKSQDEIFVTGEDYDNLSFTVAAIVPHDVIPKVELNTSYSSLNFNFKLVFLFVNQIILSTCIGTPRSCIQICPTKFTFEKIKTRVSYA
jgi:hypothetical protein